MPSEKLSTVGGIELPLPELPGSGHKEEIYNEFVGVYNSLRRIQYVMNTQLGLAAPSTEVLPQMSISDGLSVRRDRLYVEMTEASSYGLLVSVFPSAGVAKGRLAKNTGEAYRCWGVINTPGTHGIGKIVEVALGNCWTNAIGGLLPGTEYFLSSTPGYLTNAPDPLTETNIRQSIGLALTSSEMWFAPQAPGKLVSIIITP